MDIQKIIDHCNEWLKKLNLYDDYKEVIFTHQLLANCLTNAVENEFSHQNLLNRLCLTYLQFRKVPWPYSVMLPTRLHILSQLR